jgi:hypothetical protein
MLSTKSKKLLSSAFMDYRSLAVVVSSLLDAGSLLRRAGEETHGVYSRQTF